MKVKELRKLLDLIDNEEAEVYVDKPAVSYQGEWEGAVNQTFHARRGYVHPTMLRTARRPCQETSGAKESLIIYLKDNNG